MAGPDIAGAGIGGAMGGRPPILPPGFPSTPPSIPPISRPPISFPTDPGPTILTGPGGAAPESLLGRLSRYAKTGVKRLGLLADVFLNPSETQPPEYDILTEEDLKRRREELEKQRREAQGPGGDQKSTCTQGCPAGDSGGGDGGDGDGGDGGSKKGKQDKRLSKGEIKRLQDNGVDPHDLKPKYEGSKYDLFKTKNGDIVVKLKNGSGPGDPTGLNINNF